jgi:hypothetical protein
MRRLRLARFGATQRKLLDLEGRVRRASACALALTDIGLALGASGEARARCPRPGCDNFDVAGGDQLFDRLMLDVFIANPARAIGP